MAKQRVYLSLLKLGLAKVGAIVKESAISYSKVYDVLQRLSMRGLVSQIIVENVNTLMLSNPTDYTNIYREKKKS